MRECLHFPANVAENAFPLMKAVMHKVFSAAGVIMEKQLDNEQSKGRSIRIAHSEDVAAIERLMAQLGYVLPNRLIADKLGQFATSRYDEVFLVIEEARLVGCISVHILDLFPEAGRLGRVTSLVVDRSARGKGVGPALLQQADKYFTSSGCIRAEVNSGDHRPDAHRFYIANGYAEDERRFVKRF